MRDFEDNERPSGNALSKEKKTDGEISPRETQSRFSYFPLLSDISVSQTVAGTQLGLSKLPWPCITKQQIPLLSRDLHIPEQGGCQQSL